ncbi:hypothetical protein [Bacillus sp. 03113]|nr:hypothetical protein [Bacillus sp. 03113]
MKVRIIKGPHFATTEKKVHEILYKFMSEKVKEEMKKDAQKQA